MTWLTCEEPGCGARVCPKHGHTKCERHRPKKPQKPRAPPTEEQREKARKRERRRQSGVMPGWESA